MATPTEPSPAPRLHLDAPHRRAHSAGMVIPFDTLAATEAMESVGVDPRHARVFAAQLLAASRSGDAVTRPELEAALAALKTELLDRINEGQRELANTESRLVGHIVGLQGELANTESRLVGHIVGLQGELANTESRLVDRIAENQRELADTESRLVDRINEGQRELADRIAEGERRHSAQLWRLFGGIVAVAGVTVSAIKYLP